MTLPPANWYPDTENPSDERYWDGTQWTSRVRASGTATPLLQDAAAEKSSRKRRAPLWVTITVGVLGFVVGAGAGNASAGTQSEIAQLQEELQAADSKIEAHEQKLDMTAREITQHEQNAEQFASEKKALEQKRSDAEARAEAAEKRADEAKSQAEAAELRTREAEAAYEAPASEPRSFLGEPAQDTGTVYFQNCTAARNAGAAPVRMGDPGYGPHLDRDGDGVGCE